MLSKKRQGLSLAALLFAVSVPASAQGPIASVCLEMRNDIDHYYDLWREGGTPKQMEVWRKIYIRNIWKYGNANCPKYVPKDKKRRDTVARDVKPALHSETQSSTVEQQQAAL